MCDEIVIVNNNSYDQTANIAKKIQKLYPKKIRYYEYPFDVYKY